MKSIFIYWHKPSNKKSTRITILRNMSMRSILGILLRVTIGYLILVETTTPIPQLVMVAVNLRILRTPSTLTKEKSPQLLQPEIF
jgi:hypothetical protein